MIAVRGNNVYPAALEEVLRRFPEVVEYRIDIDVSAALTEVRVEVEPTAACGPASDLADRVAAAIRDELLFRAEVKVVDSGSLPRFEMKADRVRKK